jgi:hypothetical protein
LETRVEAETEKNVEFAWVATALASIVYKVVRQDGDNDDTLPVPGGPKRSIPLAGSLRPENKSGRRNGYITVSFNDVFASSSPAIYVSLNSPIDCRGVG